MSENSHSAGTKPDSRPWPKWKTHRNNCIIALVFGMPFLCGIFVLVDNLNPATTAESTSPNGRWRIEVQQPTFELLDRHFSVYVQESDSDSVRIFASFDQNGGNTKEYFVWSMDSRYVALLGDSYVTEGDVLLRNGMTIFLVYDTATGDLFCNSALKDEYPRMPVSVAYQLFGEELLEQQIVGLD